MAVVVLTQLQAERLLRPFVLFASVIPGEARVIPSERSEQLVIPSERSESRDLHFSRCALDSVDGSGPDIRFDGETRLARLSPGCSHRTPPTRTSVPPATFLERRRPTLQLEQSASASGRPLPLVASDQH